MAVFQYLKAYLIDRPARGVGLSSRFAPLNASTSLFCAQAANGALNYSALH